MGLQLYGRLNAKKGNGPYLSPPQNPVLHQKILGQQRRDLGHMFPVGFLVHAGLAIAQDSQAEESVLWG
jgi:hypothetical protein